MYFLDVFRPVLGFEEKKLRNVFRLLKSVLGFKKNWVMQKHIFRLLRSGAKLNKMPGSHILCRFCIQNSPECSMIQWYKDTKIQLYNDTMIQCTMIQCTMIQWHNDTMIQWYNDSMIQWYNDTIEWHNDNHHSPSLALYTSSS